MDNRVVMLLDMECIWKVAYNFWSYYKLTDFASIFSAIESY